MKKTLGCIRKADTDFHLIEAGDVIAVGVSGGKDSLLLLHALSLYRKFTHKDFQLRAFTVSLGLEPFDTSGIGALCRELEIPYRVEKTQIGEIIFEYRQEKNPCALCAKMRRAVLLNLCREEGCNKLALGHHREDVIESLLMSLFYEGRLNTFAPITYMDRADVTIIRPLVFFPEKEAISAAKRMQLPVQKANCPVAGLTKREDMKNLLKEFRKIVPDPESRIMKAISDTEQYGMWDRMKLPPDSLIGIPQTFDYSRLETERKRENGREE